MTVSAYFGFLNGLLVVLFLATLAIIFVYEYEEQRRERQT